MEKQIEKTTAPAGADRTEIPIPPSLRLENRDAREITRVWVAENGDLHAIIDSSLIDDVSAWGVVLTEVGKHITDAYDPYDGLSKREVFAKIKQALDERWAEQMKHIGEGDESS